MSTAIAADAVRVKALDRRFAPDQELRPHGPTQGNRLIRRG